MAIILRCSDNSAARGRHIDRHGVTLDRYITPHLAQNTTNRPSAIDARTTRHPGYDISHQKRKRVEDIFGWAKTVGLFRQTRHRGVRRVG